MSGVGRRDQPGDRIGPRPLALHLAAAMSLNLPRAWPPSRSASPIWSPDLRRLAAALDAHPPEAVAAALGRAAAERIGAFLDGVERYRAHPYRRSLTDPEPVWREGTAGLRAYGEGTGVPVLLVPSLVNRATVLDLDAGSSLVRWLAAQGIDPYLLDWGAPGAEERTFTLTDYVAGRLERALEAVRALRPDRRPAVLGYCMGGLLATALTQRRAGDVAALALLATPWDFHADSTGHASLVAACIPGVEACGEFPVDMIQALFAVLDPFLVVRKFARFGRAGRDEAADRAFIALEDWLNDGVPLAAPVARECLAGWYGANTPGRGTWRIAGTVVDPGVLRLPTLAVLPSHDRIVPPASAHALAAAIPGGRVLSPPLGHIGMVVGRRAPEAVWAPLAKFLKDV
ncbi:MAG TPA: alpha/beta fold hydrolase [Azospirillaceae bacterium]|nr:alpha/beta fold hydrolase [Azospirillaceae bacterium]